MTDIDIIKTVKFDWVNDLLAKENIFVSSHSYNNKILGIDDSSEIALRFIELNKRLVYFVTILTNDPNAIDITINAIVSKNRFKNYFNLFPNFFILIIKDNSYTVLTSKHKLLDVDLSKYLSRYLPNISTNVGSSKSINSSINDYFQSWTRNNLSKYAVISDFDAITILNDKPIIFELKRVKKDISEWMPYLDDAKNYLRYVNITKSLNGELRVIAYNDDNTSQIAYFYDLLIGETITGKKSLTNPTNVLIKDSITYNKIISTDFISTNRRIY